MWNKARDAGNVRASKCTINQGDKAMATRKRKSVGDTVAQKASRVNVRIDEDALRRLRVHCAMTGLTPGEVISRLCEGLRDWSIPVNLSARATSTKSVAVLDSVNISDQADAA